MCICGVSIILQMVVVNCYYSYPLREIPGWLKRVHACMSCTMTCAGRSRKNDVCPNSGNFGDGDFAKPVHKTDDQSVNIIRIERTQVNKESAAPEKNILAAIDVISKKFKTEEEEGNLRQEWMELARIVDRLLLFTFATIHIFLILSIFVVMPNTWDLSSFLSIAASFCSTQRSQIVP